MKPNRQTDRPSETEGEGIFFSSFVLYKNYEFSVKKKENQHTHTHRAIKKFKNWITRTQNQQKSNI